ncbi:TolC family protein [bacterium]|nr:TolC family protein [bacterium]
MNRLQIVSALLLFAVIAQVQAQEKWTLDQCEVAALNSSNTLRASVLVVNQATIETELAAGARLPMVQAQGKFQYASEIMELTLPSAPGSSPRTIEFGDGLTTDIAVRAGSTLFQGGAIKARTNSKRELEKAKRQLSKADSLKVLHNVRVAFYETLQAQEVLEIAQTQLNRVESHLQSVQEGIEAGMLNREVLLEVQIRVEQAKQQVKQAESAMIRKRLELSYLIGKTESDIVPEGDLTNSLISHETRENTQALNSRPDILSFEKKSESLIWSKRSVEASFLPSLNAEIAYHYGRPGINLIENDWMGYGTIGASMSWTLWDWNARKKNIEILDLKRDIIAKTRLEVVGQYSNRQNQLNSLYDSLSEQLQISTKRLLLQNELLEQKKSRYNSGDLEEKEYLDTEFETHAVEIEHNVLLAQLRLTEIQLLYVLGK